MNNQISRFSYLLKVVTINSVVLIYISTYWSESVVRQINILTHIFGLLCIHKYMHTNTPPGTPTYAHKHTSTSTDNTHTHTHLQMCLTYIQTCNLFRCTSLMYYMQLVY